MWRVGAMHLADDGASDDVARSKFQRFGVPLHETLEMDVPENAAFAAERFGEQKTRCAFDGEGGGMELHKLHIRQHGAGFVSDSHAVTGGNIGIGGFAIDLTKAAGGEEYSSGAQFVQ